MLTISRSGQISPEFLRGCGWSEEWLRAIPETSRPGDNVYIVYASADHEFALRLHKDLQAQGVRCWLAPADPRGDAAAFERNWYRLWWDWVLVLVSEHSVRSHQIEELVAATVQRRSPLFLTRVDGSSGGRVVQVAGDVGLTDASDWRAEACAYRGAVRRAVAWVAGVNEVRR